MIIYNNIRKEYYKKYYIEKKFLEDMKKFKHSSRI